MSMSSSDREPPARPGDCAVPCPMCGSREPAIQVHGHGQCPSCKVNIDPCCAGAPAVDLDAA